MRQRISSALATLLVGIGACLLFAVQPAVAISLIANPGFETGDLAPWFNSVEACNDGCSWAVTGADSHSGGVSAIANGNRLLEQSFAAVSTELINEISFWARMPGGGQSVASILLAYEDDPLHQVLVSFAGTGWTHFDMTGFLEPGKYLTSVGIFGCDECGGESLTLTDDWVVEAIPEPSSLALLGLGLIGLARIRHRRSC